AAGPRRIVPARKDKSNSPGGGKQPHSAKKSGGGGDKGGRFNAFFHPAARRYDLMNDLMSGGLHRAWKDALVTAVNPPKNDRAFALRDLAGGTGDVAFREADPGGAGTRPTVCDINTHMLKACHQRAAQPAPRGARAYEEGNGEDLPYPDSSVDCVTIAFGIRNVPRIERALEEAYRVLRIGGRFLCLEFSSVDLPGLDALYELYSFQLIPRVGQAVTGDREAYQYLVESIRKFPKPKAFAHMIEGAGFRRASFTPMTGGVVALHSGWRL